MKRRILHAAGALALALGSLAAPSAQGARPLAAPPRPDPAVQEEIRRAVHAAVATERDAALDALRARTADGSRDLLAQLFLYSAAATSTRDGMALAVLPPSLGLDRGELLHAVVPFLESQDEALRREAAGTLAELEGASVERPPDFSVYRPYLEPGLRTGAEPPPGLVRHLFETDPGPALLLLMRLATSDPAEQRPILWAEHTVADAVWRRRYGFSEGEPEPRVRRELATLARHDGWWARAWTAAVQSRHPFLAQPDLQDALRADAHPVVRALAGEG